MSLDRLRTRGSDLLRLVVPVAAGIVLGHGIWAASTPVSLEITNPRPFGYVIGDLVDRRINVQAASPYALVQEALPQPKRVDRWLRLRAVTMERHEEKRTNRYDVRLTYEVANVPTEVMTIALPAVALRFQGAGQSLEQTITEWPISIGPLTPNYVLARAGLEELRPDAMPVLLDTRSYPIRLGAYAATLGALALWWIASRFGIPFLPRPHGPFSRALHDLRRITRESLEGAWYRTALRRVHRAFDETAGRAVFAEQLDGFLVEHPQFDALRGKVVEFFELSRQEFFGSGAPARSPDWLLDFCRQCRDGERRLA